MTVDKSTGEILATKSKDAKAVVKQTHSDGSVVVSEEKLGTVVAMKPLATVAIGLSRTVNLGNYESMKISIMVSVPCELDEVDQAYEQGSKWADDKMQDMLGEKKEDE